MGPTRECSIKQTPGGRSKTEPRRETPAEVESPGYRPQLPSSKEIDMTKTLTALILAAFAMTAAQAASHAGGAPMKADAAKPAASAASGAKAKAAKHSASAAKKGEMKKEEAKK